MSQQANPRRRTKVILYLAAWLLALFATNPSGGLWSLAWMFPLGLFAFFYAPAFHGGGWFALLTSATVYLLHAIFYFRSRQPRRTWMLFGALVLLLLCNVAGCRGTLITH